MNLKPSSTLVFVSFFPTFIFRSNLNINEIIYTLLIFLIPIFLINYFIIKKKILNGNLLRFYLSLIIVYGIDNHLGLWSGLIIPFKTIIIDTFGIIYIPGVILFISLCILISYLILIGKDKFLYSILCFLITILLFNIFDNTKSHHAINNFINDNNKKYPETNVVIIFDEMAGLSSFESLNDSKYDINAYIKAFFKKYDFEFYSDVKSSSRNTSVSVSGLLNFTGSKIIHDTFFNRSSNYFLEYELSQNLFFDKHKSISVFQNMHIDFCKNNNVSKCYSYNPFIKKDYLNGFKDSYLTKIISIWKLNGSISSIIMWRSLRAARVIDSILEPEGHKASFQQFFKSLERDIVSKKYDLIFAHTLVPHTPYGFDDKCNYNGSLSLNNRYLPIPQKVKQHNLERKCTFYFLDAFLKNLEINNTIDSVNLTILSDHGAKIKKTEDSTLPAIYAYRSQKTDYKEIKERKNLQELFIKNFK